MPGSEAEMEALPAAAQKAFRRCQNIKSQKNPDVQCPLTASHGDYCFRHHKRPRPFHPLLSHPLPLERRATIAANRLQRWWRRRAPTLRFSHQGPAANALDLAANGTELFSLDPLSNIPRHYLFSFVDLNHHIWAFDIRTLGHYLGTGSPQQNPYTRDPLPPKAVAALHARIDWLRARKYQIRHIHTDIMTPEQCWNQQVLDVFLKMEALGFYVCPDWFHDLVEEQHYVFYTRLYSLWGWRLGLTRAQKEAVVPGHMEGGRRLFRLPPDDALGHDRNWWQRVNLALMEAFTTRAPDREQRKLGVTYVLMALVKASFPAAQALPWVADL